VPTRQFARERVRLAAGNIFLATPCMAQRPGVLISTETVFESLFAVTKSSRPSTFRSPPSD
jgi:hypothetical protein